MNKKEFLLEEGEKVRGRRRSEKKFRIPLHPAVNEDAFRLNRFKFAFTLAEVLITLGIIGVIAALTLPSLISKNNKKIRITQLKKTYSVFSQAINLSKADNGDVASWDFPASGWNAEETDLFFSKYIEPYLKINEKCVGGTGCQLDNFESAYWAQYSVKFKLADGAWCSLISFSNSQHRLVCDVNGNAKPNALGNDIFAFDIAPSVFNIQPVFGYTEKTREELVEQCKNGDKDYCFGLVLYDGFEFKEDYPITF